MPIPASNNSGKIRRNPTVLIFALMLLFVAASQARALPVAVEQVKGNFPLASSAFYLADPAGGLSILDVSSPARQNRFVPLKDGIPKSACGALWLRFSLIKNNIPGNAPRGAKSGLTLELGSTTPPAKLFVAETITTEGDVRQWREYASSLDGSFTLPDPVLLPLTVYVRINAMPPLWFAPQLSSQQADEDSGALPWLLIMQIMLGLALAVTIARGMSENEEWRFWAGAVLACVTISALYSDNGAEKSVVYLTAMPQLLTPGLAIMLMPHLGRYMLGSNKSKALDYTLIALSLPGVAAALVPLAPGLGWTARLLPLAPLLLLPLPLLAISAIKRKQSGALCYLLFTLFPCAGAGLALYALYAPQAGPLHQLSLYLPTFGYLISGVLMATVKPHTVKEKNDFFPLDGYLEHNGFLHGAPNRQDAPGQDRPAANQDHGRPEDYAPDLNPEFNPFEPFAANEPQSETSEPYPDQLQDSPPLQMAAHPGHAYASAENAQTGESPLKSARTPAGQTENVVAEPAPDQERASAPGPAQDDDDIIELDASLQIIAPAHGKAEHSRKPSEAVNATLESMAQLAELFGNAAPEEKPAPAPFRPMEAAAPAKLRRADNVIYIKDEEEPGLVILKPADPAAAARAEPEAPDLPPLHNPQLDVKAIDRVENALRAPYENLRVQLAQMRGQQTDSADLADRLEASVSSLGLMLDNLEKVARGEHPSPAPMQSIFNLSALIRHMHEQMLPLAESKGVTLSWFVAPGLPTFFKGNEEKIADALRFLLQGSLEAADAGAVQLTVREARGYAGQVQFSLLESGLGISNLRRPSGWLNKAWELSSASGGSFNIDFLPGKGTAITFTLALTPMQKPAEALYDDPQPALSGADFTPGAPLQGENATQKNAPAPDESANQEHAPARQKNSAAQAQNAESASSAHNKLPGGSFEHKPDQPQYEQALTEPGQSASAAWLHQNGDARRQEEDRRAQPALNQAGDRTEKAANLPENDIKPELTAPETPREYIVIADMAASGRRLIARRLDGLPHKLVEARNSAEVIAACAAHPVGLIIFDADLPEADVRAALQGVSASLREKGLPLIPSLGLIAHASQGERMTRLGCRETQIKSASRTQFRQAVLALCPHPETDPAELLPESPLLRSNQADASPAGEPEVSAAQSEAKAQTGSREAETAPTSPSGARPDASKMPGHAAMAEYPASADAAMDDTAATKSPDEYAASKAAPVGYAASMSAPAGHAAATAAPVGHPHASVPGESKTEQTRQKDGRDSAKTRQTAQKAERVPMLDMIVASLDQDEPENGRSTLPEARKLESPHKLAQSENDYMDATMVPLLPGFLIVLEDTLEDLQKARGRSDTMQVQEVAARMAGQGGTYGLNPLERMARCVERAAEAGDKEAVNDLSEELLSLGKRYLTSLKLTYDEYVRNKE